MRSIITSTLIVLVIVGLASADVPQVINYQGRLTDDTGAPVDGPHLIKFKIYGSATGNDSLWSSSFQTVQIDSGLFEYQLGASVQLPDDLFETDTTRYLGITIGVDPEIAPRVSLMTAPYAYQALRSDSADYAALAFQAGLANNALSADNADYLGGYSPSYYLAWSNLSGIPPDIADGDDDSGGDITGVTAGSGLSGGGASGSVSLYIDNGDITSSHIAPNAVGSSEIIDESITTADIQNGSVYSADIANETILSADIDNGTIVDADINSSAAIATSKISGTAVNLSSIQTIAGTKTFDGYVIFGDSTMRVSNTGIRIGDNSAPTSTYLMRLGRTFNTTVTRYGFYLNLNNTATEGALYGVYSRVDNADASTGYRYAGRFFAGNASNTAGTSYGVRSNAYGGNVAYGIYAAASSATSNYGGYFSPGLKSIGKNYAGYFNGDVETIGFTAMASGGMKIDHPLDPENQYLIHSDVVSPEMKSVYDGVVILDGNGEATVELPDYFETLNSDFRYQLTAIGLASPNLHVANEIAGNRFAIAGGKPFMKVSWQVTGVRNDAYAKSNRVQNEISKPDKEKGLYLHPEAFGFEENMQIHYEQNKKHLERPEEREE